jgi:chromosome segregation ATPase
MEQQAKANLKTAEQRLAKAGAAVARLSKVRFNLSGQINKLNMELRTLRLACYEAIAAEHPANYEAARQKIHECEEMRNDLTKVMSYIVSWSLADANIEQASANYAERDATAKLFEAEADHRRSELERLAQGARELAPDLKLSNDSKTTQLLNQSARARREADTFQAQVTKLQAERSHEQDLIAGGLFNG